MDHWPSRKPHRLAGYDYSQAGLYFITLCTQKRESIFGEIAGGEMTLNPYGQIVAEEWQRTEILRPWVALLEWVVMPNHFHAIILLNEQSALVGAHRSAPGTARECNKRAHCGAPLQENYGTGKMPVRPKRSIGSLVAGFKGYTAKRINEQRDTPPGLPVWQRNYHDHIIRNHESYRFIAAYVLNNPAKWSEDSLNPANTTGLNL